jgi:hypothetical protein
MVAVMATPSLLPTSKARLWGLHGLSKLVKVPDKVVMVVKEVLVVMVVKEVLEVMVV